MKKKLSTVLLALAAFMPMTAQNLVKGDYGYLYCHMSDKGEWTAYAVSRDGYNYQDINEGKPIFDPEEHARIEGGTRDAYITRTHDGKGYIMVTTDMSVRKSHKWDNYGIDLLKSKDLIHWTSVTFDYRKGMQNFCDAATAQSPYKDWSTINRVWAPQIFWDPDYRWENGEKGGYMIYYSMLNRAEESTTACTTAMLIRLSPRLPLQSCSSTGDMLPSMLISTISRAMVSSTCLSRKREESRVFIPLQASI